MGFFKLYFCLFIYLVAVLGIKPRTMSMLGKPFIIELHLVSLLLFIYFIVFVLFFETGFLSPGCPGTHSVDQPSSASQVLGLKACATTA